MMKRNRPGRAGRTANIAFEYRMFWALCAALVILTSLYVYFVASSIFNVVLRKEAEQARVEINSNLGELESEYFALKNSIDIERAHKLGFVSVSNKKFVARTSGEHLTFNQ